MFCPKCGKQLPDGARFCVGCGSPMTSEQPQAPAQPNSWFTSPQVDPINPPVNGNPAPANPPVYGNPAQPYGTPVPPTGSPAPGRRSPAPSRKPAAKQTFQNILGSVKDFVKKVPRKIWMIGGIALAVLIVVIVLLCIFTGGSSASSNGSGVPDGVLYLKDSELYYSDYSKKAPWEITSDLADDASNFTLRACADEIANTIHVTEDGKTMFYLDKLSGDSGTLYYRSLTNMKSEATKIAADVYKYTVSKDGKLVIYKKGDTLYQYNMKEETKIGKDVSFYYASPDCKIVYYKNQDGAWYSVKNGDSEKIASDITVERISEDYSTIYYSSDEKVYKKVIGKEKEKLVSGVDYVYSIADDGTFYFTKSAEVNMADFFVADGGEYDYVLEYIADWGALDFSELYYYDGKNDVKLSECCEIVGGGIYEDNNVRAYTSFNSGAQGSISTTRLYENYMENYSYLYDAASAMITETMEEDSSFCVAVNGTVTALELQDVSRIRISDDGKTLGFLCDVDDSEGDLYKATVSKNKVKTPAIVDDGVYSYELGFAGDWLVYYKDVKDDEGDLYADGKLVDSDVSDDGWNYLAESKQLFYMTDYNSSRDYGVLKSWNGKSAVEIYDEAYSIIPLENGDVLVAYDYSSSKSTCSLSVWNGKKLTEIAEDVYTIEDSTDDGKLLLALDYSSSRNEYTLCLWNGKKLVEVSDEVYDAVFQPDGDVLYLYDYSTSKYEGELYRYNGKKSVLVDEDVAAIIVLPRTVSHYFDD